MSSSYYAIIPADVRYAKIPANAKLLYGEITALCNEQGFCWAKNRYFTRLYAVDKRTIQRWIMALVKKGFIHIEAEVSGMRKIYLTRVTKMSRGGDKNVAPTLYINNNTMNTMGDDEIVYEPIDQKPTKKTKSKYGSATMAVLVRKFAACAGVPIGKSFDASAWSKPLAAILKYYDGNADEAMAYIDRASGYYRNKNLNFMPSTLAKALPMMDKWLAEKPVKKNPRLRNMIIT